MKKLFITILSSSFFTLAIPVQAQVYQWKDPQTGSTRFSNTAPSWFRNSLAERSTPRVRVYYYDSLVDDSGLSLEERQALRAQSAIGRFLPPLQAPRPPQAATAVPRS